MKQVNLDAYGAADVLHIVHKPIPNPGSGEVLVQVEAAGVNFSDILRRRNTYFMPTPLPYVLGAEAVGTITALGEGCPPHLEKGMRVLAILPSGGGYAEFVSAPAMYCVPLPSHMEAPSAAGIFVQGSTAYLMIQEVAPPLAGKTVLIHAASGGVGSLLTQMALQAGAKVIGTGSSAEKLAFIEQLGAQAAINYQDPNWPSKVLEANGGDTVEVVFEMVGGEIYQKSFSCLATGGTLIVYGAASGSKGFVHSEHFVDENQTVTGFNLAFYLQHKSETWQKGLGAVIELLAEGKIQVLNTHRYSLEESQQAHQDIEDRKTTGKVVLIP